MLTGRLAARQRGQRYSSGDSEEKPMEPMYDENEPLMSYTEKKQSLAKIVARKIRRNIPNPLDAIGQKYSDMQSRKQGYERFDESYQVKKLTSGPLVEADAHQFQVWSENIGKGAATVANLGTNLVVEKLVGDNLKEGLPISFKRHVLINCGQILTVASDVVGLFPVLGEPVATPLTFGGTLAEQKGRGFTAAQSTAIASHVTGIAAATGAIPYAGTGFTIANLANDLRNLCTPIPETSKLEAITQMRAARDKAYELQEVVNRAAQEAQDKKMDELNLALTERLRAIDHYIKKYDLVIVQKMESGKAGLIKYMDYETESDLNDASSFDKYINNPLFR
jgi:hypothetical protein